MALPRLSTVCRTPIEAPAALVKRFFPAFMLCAGIMLAGLIVAAMPAVTQERAQDAVVKQVASDLYLFFDFEGSNSVFLVTNDGVLVIQ